MSVEATFSPHWYRVAGLTPRLRPHVSVHRHRYRGHRWYVLQDNATGQHHRLNYAAYQFIGLLNGERPVHIAWTLSNERAGDDAPTQDQAIEMLSQLHQANLVEADVNADFDALLQRQRKSERRKRTGRFLNPLMVRLPLFDPDRILDRIKPWSDPFFSLGGALLWLVIVLGGAVLAAMHWEELRAQPLVSLGEPGNILMMALVYPLVKLLHEMAHGLAIKRWGGEVHELGIALLVLMPVPFVDGKSAAVFASKWQRAAVASAGVAAELLIAVFALVLWLQVGEGLLRDMLFSAMLITGVSTLFFNGNPLMRFDAYYVLADLIEIPDLWKRSRRFYAQVFKRLLTGQRDNGPPLAHDGRERAWLLLYGALSWSYWLVVLAGLVLFVSGVSTLAALLLGAWAVSTVLLVPLYRGLKYLHASAPGLRPRMRALSLPLLLAVPLLAGLFLVPVGQYSRIQGVVWTPQDSRVLAGADCLASEVSVQEGQWVSRADVLLRCEGEEHKARILELEAQLREIRALIDGYLLDDRVKRRVAIDRLRAKRKELESLREENLRLVVRASADGYFHSARGQTLPGNWYPKGADIGHVLKGDRRTVLAVIEQEDIGLFGLSQTQIPRVRLHADAGRVIDALDFRVLPGAVKRLPSPALAIPNGGPIAVVEQAGGELATLNPVYLVEVTVPADQNSYHVGGRAELRFQHADEPLGLQWLMRLRQLFLGSVTL